ncbi:MAG: hypothetical protein AAFY76_09160 [Cyanobacteria bacterium J06649_11]
MPYVLRDQDGNITAAFPAANKSATEELPADHPDLCAFMRGVCTKSALQEQLASSDQDMVRVLEDLIDVLIEQNVIELEYLPDWAQRKLMFRKDLRWQLKQDDGFY